MPEQPKALAPELAGALSVLAPTADGLSVAFSKLELADVACGSWVAQLPLLTHITDLALDGCEMSDDDSRQLEKLELMTLLSLSRNALTKVCRFPLSRSTYPLSPTHSHPSTLTDPLSPIHSHRSTLTHPLSPIHSHLSTLTAKAPSSHQGYAQGWARCARVLVRGMHPLRNSDAQRSPHQN